MTKAKNNRKLDELRTRLRALEAERDKAISDADRSKMDDKIYDMERKLIVSWLDEALKVSPEDKISVLALYYEKAPTEHVRDRIQREIGSIYNEIVNQALNEYPENVQKLRELFTRLSRGRDMPAQVRETLQTTITAAENKAREVYTRVVLQKIGAANTFNDLGKLLQDPNIDVNNEAIQTQVSSTVQKLFGNDLPVRQWLFWVFNHVALPGSDNMTQCEQLRRNIKAMNIDVSDTVIVDCSDIEDVAVNLIDSALNFLAENIERNDNIYAQNIQQAITAVIERVNSILKNVQSVLRDDDESDTDSRKFDDLFAKLWRVLRRNIQNFVGRNSDLRRDKDSDCEEFKTVIEQILDRIVR